MVANLLSELERFEQEMKDLGSEPSSSLMPPSPLVSRVLLPPPPPPPARLSADFSYPVGVPLTSANGGTVAPLVSLQSIRPPPPPPPVLTAVMAARPVPTISTLSVTTHLPWLNTSAAAPATALGAPSTSAAAPSSHYAYSQSPASYTAPPSQPPPSSTPASSTSYFPVPFHLQQQPQTHQRTQQYQQSYQQGAPQQFQTQPQGHLQPHAGQTTAIISAPQPSYQYQAVYQPAAPAPEIYTMPQQQQAQQLFQRDAQTITPEALESVKAALASGEGEQKSEAKKKSVPRKAAGQTWEDPTLADWPENDHRLFCGDLGNEVNDEVLTKAFTRFTTFNMARVVRDKRTGKTKGYGFVSFANPSDLALALKEMNGKYVGNRPIKLRKSSWKERTNQEAYEKQKNSKKQKTSKKSVLHK